MILAMIVMDELNYRRLISSCGCCETVNCRDVKCLLAFAINNIDINNINNINYMIKVP